MSWRLRGDYLENCNCEVACPCTVANFAAPATYEEGCKALLGFHIDSGEVDGVDVSGLTVAVVLADSPQMMIEGGWRVGLVMDEAASPEQTDKLAAVFSGQLGGPMAALAPLLGEFLGVERARMQYEHDGRRRSLAIGDRTRMEVEEINSPVDPEAEAPRVTGVTGHVTGAALAVARGSSQVDALGVSFANADKSAFTAEFAWSA